MKGIYRLLSKFKEEHNIDIIKYLEDFNELDKYYVDDNNNEKEKNIYYLNFRYKNVTYYFSQLPHSENYSKEIWVKDIDCKLNYGDILVLLFVIQAKSNYFEHLSYSKYVNGLINMLIVLLNNTKDNIILKEKGWIYSEKLKIYENTKLYDNSLSNKKKWYLTKEERNNIMSKES